MNNIWCYLLWSPVIVAIDADLMIIMTIDVDLMTIDVDSGCNGSRYWSADDTDDDRC